MLLHDHLFRCHLIKARTHFFPESLHVLLCDPLFRCITLSGSVSTQGIALDVADNCLEMTIFLNRKGLESPLVEMARSFGVVVSVPTHCVGMRQPPKEIGYLILVLRFDNKMPMIGHHDVRKDRQCHFVPGTEG